MNWEQVEINWLTFYMKAQERWSALSAEELNRIAGSREQLRMLLETRYGLETEEAEREVRNWQAGLCEPVRVTLIS